MKTSLIKNTVAAIATSLFVLSGAQATVIYENDFSTGDDAGWTGGSIVSERYQQSGLDAELNFELSDSAINSYFNLSFDVFTLGTWDNSPPGHRFADYFVSINKLSAGGGIDEVLFDGAIDRGSNSFSFFHVDAFSVDQLQLAFTSRRTGPDEFVAIDNVRISAVPEPATLALIGLGLAGVGFSRRKTS